jgi:multiple sugar transport system permease protein
VSIALKTSGAGRGTMSRASREALYGYLMISPWLLGFLVLTAGPMLASVVISLYDTNFLNKWDFYGLRWYTTLLGDTLVWKALRNTAYYALGAVPLSTGVALCIAVLLNQGIKGQGVWRTIYYLPSVVSGVAISLLWKWLYNPEIGLFNALLARIGIEGPAWLSSEEWALPALVIMAGWSAGSAMLIFLAGLRGIPTALYEAASIDGAGTFRQFFAITIPMLTPTIFFNVVMNIIGSWQVFTQSFTMTDGGPNNATLTLVLYIYKKGFQQFFFGYAAAIAWLLFVVILAFVLIAIRTSSRWVTYERV